MKEFLRALLDFFKPEVSNPDPVPPRDDSHMHSNDTVKDEPNFPQDHDTHCCDDANDLQSDLPTVSGSILHVNASGSTNESAGLVLSPSNWTDPAPTTVPGELESWNVNVPSHVEFESTLDTLDGAPPKKKKKNNKKKSKKQNKTLDEDLLESEFDDDKKKKKSSKKSPIDLEDYSNYLKANAPKSKKAKKKKKN